MQHQSLWRRWSPRTGFIALIIPVMLLAACTGLSTNGTTNPAASNDPCMGNHQATQPGSTGDLGSPITGGTPTGSLSPNQTVHLNIALNVNRAALDTCLSAMYDPSSPDYGKYLAPQDIASRFAPSSADVAKLTKFLTNSGLTVTQSYTTNAALTVEGTAAQVEKAFSISLSTYQQGQRNFYKPNQAPTLPTDLQSVVATIAGLSTQSFGHCDITGTCGFIQHYSHFTLPKNAPKIKSSFDGDCAAASIGVPFLTGGAPTTLLTWKELRQSYGLDTLATGGFDGGTSAIGMVEFDEYSRPDVVNYMQCAGTYAIDRIVNDVVVQGGPKKPDDGPGAGEATLDLEMALGLTGPKTKVIDYYAPNNDQWESSLQDILHRVASDKKVSVLSISYGDFENDMTRSYMTSVNDTMKILAAEGISVFVASGDCAAYGSGQFGTKALSFPASAPWAISVGGTTLSADPLTGSRQDETTWVNDKPDQTVCQNTWGSGGGLSVVPSFTLPAWQKGPGVGNQYSNGARQVPDVSAAAINISFYYSGFWLGVGGTSAAAPIWASGVDVANQDLIAAHKPTVGGVPNLYSLAAGSGGSRAYFDITKGSNLFYPATKGWDFVTGWGSPQFDQIAATLGGS